MRMRTVAFTYTIAVLALGSSPLAHEPRRDTQAAGIAYLMTNSPRGNAVFEFTRLANGQLVFADRQSTGGAGGTLISQHTSWFQFARRHVGSCDRSGSTSSVLSKCVEHAFHRPRLPGPTSWRQRYTFCARDPFAR